MARKVDTNKIFWFGEKKIKSVVGLNKDKEIQLKFEAQLVYTRKYCHLNEFWELQMIINKT